MMRSLNGNAAMRRRDPVVKRPCDRLLVGPKNRIRKMKTYLNRRHPTRFWYGKKDRARWNKAYRVTEGTKHNWYRRHGMDTPRFSPPMPPHIPSFVSGRMSSLKSKKEAELVQENHTAHHHEKPIVVIDLQTHAQPENVIHLAHPIEPKITLVASAEHHEHSIPLIIHPDSRPVIQESSEKPVVQQSIHLQYTHHNHREESLPKVVSEEKGDAPTINTAVSEPEHHTTHHRSSHHHGHHTHHHHSHHSGDRSSHHHSEGHRHHTGGHHHESSHRSKPFALPLFWFDVVGSNYRDDMMIKGSGKYRHKTISFRPLRESIQKLPTTPSDAPIKIENPVQTTKHIGYIPSHKRKVLQLKVAQGAEAVPPQ